ncbi:MAG: P-II family nitrogen regulator [Candidatus Omnitrophica bacterium]|nr:P-II family nitrogen regulator [Candidatus Omnitrophota bacterium]
MKMIHAIIRREKLAAVKDALDAVKCPGMMVWEIVGHGKQKGITEQFRGREFKVDLLPKTKIEIIVSDSQVKAIVEAIVRTASTNKIGDGKIFVSPIEDAIRIRTGERGDTVVL